MASIAGAAAAAASASSTTTSRILQAQRKIFRHHLPASLLQRMETPLRHHGINSVRVPGTDPSLAPIVITHGYGSGLGFFFANLPALCNSGRTVYLVDWLGFAGSERPSVGGGKCFTACSSSSSKAAPVNADFFILPLHQWMESERISQCRLVGHSLGGLLACRFAERFPDKLEKLVLASPAGMSQRIGRQQPTAPPSSLDMRNKLLDLVWSSNALTPQKIVRSLGPTRGRALVHRAVQGRFGASVTWHAGLVADYLYEITAAKASAGDVALGTLLAPPFQNRHMLARDAFPDALPSGTGLTVHTIFGDHDWLNTPSALEHARRLGALSVMRNSGHHLYLDNPHEFARLCLV